MSKAKSRHVTADGYVLMRAPSIVSPVFPVTRPATDAFYGDGTPHQYPTGEHAFHYWIGGVKFTYKADTKEQAVFEWDRLVDFQSRAEVGAHAL